MALAVTPLSDLPHTTRMVGCGPGICPKWREPFEFFSGTTPFAAMIPHCDPPPSTMVPPPPLRHRSTRVGVRHRVR